MKLAYKLLAAILVALALIPTAFAAMLFLGGYKDLVIGDALPPNGNLLNIKNFGAVGDGVHDDTAACNAAVSALPPYQTIHDLITQIIYFPAGTYLFSDTCTRGNPANLQSSNVVFIGENVATTHIKLANSTTGFTNAGSPKAIFQFNSGNLFGQSWYPVAGWGNEGFHNTVENITFDLGSGNAGAEAINTVMNNINVYRNLVINTTGAAYGGIVMDRGYNGPGLTTGVTINGPFQYCIDVWWTELSPTFEHITCNGATVVGIRNNQNSITMRDVTITMNGGIGFQQADQGGTCCVGAFGPNEGLTTWYTGTINGTGTAAVQILNGAYTFQGVNSVGFNGGGTVSYDGVYQNGTQLYSSPGWTLTVKNTPKYTVPATTQWTQVVTSQVPADATADIQTALNNPAARVVYLPTGDYNISGPVTVPDWIDRIECLYSRLRVTAGGYAFFTVNATRTKDLYVRRCLVENGGTGLSAFVYWQAPPPARLIMTDYSGPLAIRSTAGAGEVYGEDLNATHLDLNSTAAGAWMRQLDPEITTTKIYNTNGTLWVLGLKAEQASTALANDGGNVEWIGGLTYPGNVVTDPKITNVNNGRVVATYVSEELTTGLGWTQEMTSTINGISNTIATSSFFQRGPYNGRTVALVNTDYFVPTIQSSRGNLVSVLASATVGTVLTTASLTGSYAYTGTPVWSLSSSAGGKYTINSSTGVITVNAGLTAGTDNISVHVTGLTMGASSGATVADLPISVSVRTSFSSFDAANCATHITLSGSNLIGTANFTDANGSICRGLGHHSTGTYYAEFTIGTVAGVHGVAVGVVNALMPVTNGNSMGYEPNHYSISYASFGRVEYGNTGVDLPPSYIAGDVIGMLVDTDNRKVTWFKNNTQVSQISITATTGDLYPAIECDDNTSKITANFGPASSYIYSHPAGDW